MRIDSFLNILISLNLLKSFYCNETPKEEILSRRRRYLTFPTGSSFQLVYDQIIPIVDYENLFIFGVTTALAWQLPDKPVYVADLMEMYENGTLPLLDRIDENVPSDGNATTGDNKPTIEYSNNKNDKYDNYYNNKGYYDQYYKNINKYSAINRDRVKPNYKQSSNKMDYYLNRNRFSDDQEILNQINQYSAKTYKPWKESSWGKTKNAFKTTSRPVTHSKHFIYPAFGKRSIAQGHQIRSYEDELYEQHHRTTRQNLYTTIEKYLTAHGKHGEECVRKALCETSRKRDETEPGTFIGEIMRVIFSLPTTSGRPSAYDDAFFSEHNCTERFPKCKDSVWESDFIY